MYAHSDESGQSRDHGADEANDAWPGPWAGDSDNESISSWGNESGDGDEFEVFQPSVKPLGLSRRSGFSDYDDYDVVTVHGARDDPQTAWTAANDRDVNWIQDILFSSLSVRQLDYVYDTGNSARIYNPDANGIAMEADALLDSLARNRDALEITEEKRPIIWICHDLGGTIVKQALINAIHGQPRSKHEDDSECAARLRSIYRRLPVLTSMIIFLGCPHGNESKEELEDQLFTLLSLPGPPLRTQVLQKAVNLSRRVEKINLEFLETKVLDRAVIINITTVADDDRQLETEAAITSQTSPNPPVRLFSMQRSAMLQNMGVHTMMAKEQDHLGLVRGPDPELTSWTDHFRVCFNRTWGYNLKIRHADFNAENSLLSLSPPTSVNKYLFRTEGRRPPLASWIMEQNVFERHLRRLPRSGTVYLHGGRRGSQVVDMKLVSRQLFTAYDLMKKEDCLPSPGLSCFYFEFSKYDSRRAGIKDMIISLVRTQACRLWLREDDYFARCARYLEESKSCSLQTFIDQFLELHQEAAMIDLTLILGRIDQCDDEERHIFLQALIRRQSYSERVLKVIITTNGPEDTISVVLPANATISLDDYPQLEDEYLSHSNPTNAAQDRMQRLLARRPEFAGLQFQLYEILGKFNETHGLQELVSDWLAEYRGISNQEPSEILREAASNAHHKLFQWAVDQVSVNNQQMLAHMYDWIKYAEEPLTLEILFDAIRHSLPDESVRPYFQGHEEFRSFVDRLLRGIIFWDGRDIKFSDEVFYSLPGIGGSHAEREKTCRAHADMATACLRYLLGPEGLEMLNALSVEKQGMDDLGWVPIALPRHSLVSYALRFWPLHYHAAGGHRPTDLAIELLQDMPRRAAWTEALYVVSNPFTRIQTEYLSSLPYMAMFGLDDLVLREIESEQGNNGLNQDCWLAIIEAARNGQGSTVALLLEHTDMDDDGLREALHWATRKGGGEALDCLVSVARKHENFSWPLGLLGDAVSQNVENFVLALVQAGADLDSEDGIEQANISAIYPGREHLLKILLDGGRVEPNFWYNGDSSLVQATWFGSPMSVQHLLDAGASIESNDEIAIMMFDCIKLGHHGVLELLIQTKIIPIDFLTNRMPSDPENRFPILCAAEFHHHECVRVLLDNGVDANFIFEDGSALYLALANGPNFEVCRVLLEKGADPNESTADPNESTAERPLHSGRLLMRAIGTGDKALVRMLLDYGAKINVVYENGTNYDTPLASAIHINDYDTMELLLERGGDANLTSDCGTGFSALFAAVWDCRETRFIKTLINHGANVRWTYNFNGWTVLHAAYDSADKLSLLLQHGADVNATKNDGFTTLILAAGGMKKESVQVLLKQTNPKADLELTSDDSDLKITALLRACEYYDADILKLLLEAGADVNCQRSDGESPLGLLLEYYGARCEDGVEMILKRRPNLKLSNSKGETLLHKIKHDTSLSIIMRLVEEGAPVNTVDASDQTPLTVAVRSKNLRVARYLTTVKGVQCNLYQTSVSLLHEAAVWSLEMVKQLVRTGADPTVVTDFNHGATLLYAAIESGGRERRKIIRYLVEEIGVDVNALGGPLVHPFKFAILYTREPSLVKYLLRHGIRLDQADKFGCTAVHWATRHGRRDIVKLLLEFGADLSVADSFGRTPLHGAAARRDIRLIKYILKNLPQDVDNINLADVDGWTPLMWACKSWCMFDDLGGSFDVPLVLIDEYKADARVRSKDGNWSPLKLAVFHSVDHEYVQAIAKRVEEQGVEESQVSQDLETKRNRMRPECHGCFTACYGPAWTCFECGFNLCFKCIPHKESMHDPEHDFNDMDDSEWRKPWEIQTDPRMLVSPSMSEKEEKTESETEADDDDDDDDDEEEEEEEEEE